MTATVTQAAMLRRFMIAIMSSWVTGPLGALYLHHIGWGDDTTAIAILLALSAGAPVQLLMNEFVAAGIAAGHFAIRIRQLAMMFAATALSTTFALLYEPGLSRDGSMMLLTIAPALLTTVSIFLSFGVSIRFYRSVIQGASSQTAAAAIGMTPGLLMLASFMIAGTTGAPRLMLIAAIVPATVQFLVAWWVLPAFPAISRAAGTRALDDLTLYGLAMVLGLAGLASALLRASIANIFTGYGVLVLAALNLAGTTVIALSRSRFLHTGRTAASAMAMAAIALASLALPLFLASEVLAILVLIFSLQLAVVSAINFARQLDLSIASKTLARGAN